MLKTDDTAVMLDLEGIKGKTGTGWRGTAVMHAAACRISGKGGTVLNQAAPDPVKSHPGSRVFCGTGALRLLRQGVEEQNQAVRYLSLLYKFDLKILCNITIYGLLILLVKFFKILTVAFNNYCGET